LREKWERGDEFDRSRDDCVEWRERTMECMTRRGSRFGWTSENREKDERRYCGGAGGVEAVEI